MNYFEFYEIPVSFKVDEHLLKRRYYEISRSSHPDFHTLSSEEQQEEALHRSTLNNQAFKTLTDFDQRLKYILDLFGKLKGEGENKVPQDFLMDMMDINESLMELEMDPSEEKLSILARDIKSIETTLHQELTPLLEKEVNTLSESEWTAISEYFLKTRYLGRLKENLDRLSDPDSI